MFHAVLIISDIFPNTFLLFSLSKYHSFNSTISTYYYYYYTKKPYMTLDQGGRRSMSSNTSLI